jgi:crossover junction endodeoxyribonuclease RuvC
MKVLSIDPGYDRLGMAVLTNDTGHDTLLYSACVETDRTAPLPDRLLTLGEAVRTLLVLHTPDAVAIETLFFNKNVKTAIGVAQARGLIVYLAKAAGCQVYEFGPQEIKVAITGHGASDKTAVLLMLTRLLPDIPPRAHDDEYDAIAVGITCLAHYGRGQ